MINERLLHDTAWATSLTIVEIFNLRDEEKVDAFHEVYARVKIGIESYVLFREQECRRLYGKANGEN